ncbi:MAG: MFS transporter [Chloroflexota bacterium]
MPTLRLTGLWRHGDFMRLWSGQTISQFGSQITLLALPLVAALLLKASPFEMGLLGAAEMAPFLLIGLPAGVWVDRWPRRPVLIAGDLGRALAIGSIPLTYELGQLSMSQLYVVAFVTGIFTVFFDVAYMSYLPALVERERLVEGNSKMEVTRAAAQIAGPGLGGSLVQILTAPVAMAFDAVSFVVSAVFLISIRRVETPPERRQEGQSMYVGIAEGLRYVLTHRLLRSIAASTAISNLFSSATYAIYVLFAVRELDLSPAALGFVFGLGNLGFLVGAFVAAPITRRFGLGSAITYSIALSGLAGLLVPLATSAQPFPYLLTSQLLVGFGVVVYNINQVSLRQAITPDRIQGRMNATMRFLVWSTMPIGSLIGGALGEWLGLRPALWLAAAGGTLSFLWVALSPVRTLREQPSPSAG